MGKYFILILISNKYRIKIQESGDKIEVEIKKGDYVNRKP